MPTLHSENDEQNLTVEDLNPRSQAVKGIEMTVRRALVLLDLFRRAEDPMEIGPTEWKKIYGDGWYTATEIKFLPELVRRYKNQSLHQEILDLYEALPASAQKHKEIAPGIKKIRKELGL